MSSKRKRVEISSSFRVGPGGQVDEVTWTQEDVVLRRLKYDPADEGAFLTARHSLRAMAASGKILYRRNPEHGYWEYGPSWRAKGFALEHASAQAENMLLTTEAE